MLRVSVCSGFILCLFVLGMFLGRLIYEGPVRAGERIFRSNRLHTPASAAAANCGLVVSIAVLSWVVWRMVRNGTTVVVSRVRQVHLRSDGSQACASARIRLRRGQAVAICVIPIELHGSAVLRTTLTPLAPAGTTAVSSASLQLEPNQEKHARALLRTPENYAGDMKLRFELQQIAPAPAVGELQCRWWKSLPGGEITL